MNVLYAFLLIQTYLTASEYTKATEVKKLASRNKRLNLRILKMSLNKINIDLSLGYLGVTFDAPKDVTIESLTKIKHINEDIQDCEVILKSRKKIKGFYLPFFSKYSTVRVPLLKDYGAVSIENPLAPIAYEPAGKSEDWRWVADSLKQKVRVLCWILTQPSNHKARAKHVKATWGKRCNKLLFMSTSYDPFLPTVKLPVQEGRSHLWGKTKAALRYVYKHHRDDADWFLKADDDTYVIVENLRYMLAGYDPDKPIYFGCRFNENELKKEGVKIAQGYMSGGAGYVLSRAALDRFVNKGLRSRRRCRPDDTGAEDVELGICLERIGVRAMDSRDSLHRGRFFPFPPWDHLSGPTEKEDYWYWRQIYYPTDDSPECCSNYSVSFHYVRPEAMYALDYLIYSLRPANISYH